MSMVKVNALLNWKNWMRCLVTASIITVGALAVLFTNCSSAADLILEGTVLIDGVTPVRGGRIVISELDHKTRFQMPEVDVLSVPVTDRDGKYLVRLKGVKGELDITLIRDKCSWRSDYAVVTKDVVESSGKLTVNLNPASENCLCDKSSIE